MVLNRRCYFSESDKTNPSKKTQFRGNTNYQHFLELEQKRRMKSNELEQRIKRTSLAPTSPVTVPTTTETPTTTTTTTIRPTVAPKKIISRRLMAKKTVVNNSTISATTPTTTANSYKEVVRRKKKASVVNLDRDNEIQSRDEREEELPSQRFLSPSVRKYLALGRAIPGEWDQVTVTAQLTCPNHVDDDHPALATRSSRNRLSNPIPSAVHKLLLRWARVPGLFCRYGDALPRSVPRLFAYVCRALIVMIWLKRRDSHWLMTTTTTGRLTKRSAHLIYREELGRQWRWSLDEWLLNLWSSSFLFFFTLIDRLALLWHWR